jgi:hypothetical protein
MLLQEEAVFSHAPGKLDDKICTRVDESCPDIHGQTSKTSNQLLKNSLIIHEENTKEMNV